MAKKIILLLILAALIGGGYYLWQNRYEYFFQGDQLQTEEESGNGLDEGENGQQEPAVGEIIDETQDGLGLGNATGSSVEISNYDCDQQCENRKGTDKYKYCLEICGLSDLGNGLGQSENCEGLSGFEKDVCFKNKAIKEKNDSSCDQIEDVQLKESCVNRVLEEIL